MAFDLTGALRETRGLGSTRRGDWAARFRLALPGNLFLIPIAAVFVVLYLIPLAQSVYNSFTNANGYSPDADFVGFSNYLAIFRDPSLLAGLSYTLLYAIGTTVVVTVLAIPIAVVLNRRFVGRNFVRSVIFFPAVPSVAVLGLVWGFIFNPLGSGVLNALIHALTGLPAIPWLSDANLAQLSTIIVAVWAQTGWHAILYLAYLQSIPSDYIEVATIDGASRWRIFRSITLPLLTPAVAVSTLLLMTGGLKVYDLPFTLTKGGPGFATYTITQAIIDDGIAQARMGIASALSVVFLLAVAIVVLAQLAATRLIERRFI